MEIRLRRGQKEFKCPKCETDIEVTHGRFNSNQKGSVFEAFVAREMSTAMYGEPKVLQRTPTSGAMANFWPFDIYPAKIGTQRFPFAVECKHRRDWSLEDILYNRTTKQNTKGKADKFILDWWDHLKREIPKYTWDYGEKIPILIFKKNREKPLVMLEKKHCDDMGCHRFYTSHGVIVRWDDFIHWLKGVTWEK